MKFLPLFAFALGLCTWAGASVADDQCGGIPGQRISGRPENKQVPTYATLKFPGDLIAVRAPPLRVNSDGGKSSYIFKKGEQRPDLGFSYLSDGVDRWVPNPPGLRGKSEGKRYPCDKSCEKDLLDAAGMDFGPGTKEFCAFGFEVGPGAPSCGDGNSVIGNGKGKPLLRQVGNTPTAVLSVDGKTELLPYLSTTSIKHPENGALVYLDAESVPFLVTTDRNLFGHIAWVGGPGLHGTWAVFADSGHFGEGSIALHQYLLYNRIIPQAPGHLPAEMRCKKQKKEPEFDPPFGSAPDIKNDFCKDVHSSVTGGTNVRANTGLDHVEMMIFAGEPKFSLNSSKDHALETVTKESIDAKMKGHEEQVTAIVTCLRNVKAAKPAR
ncbi:hypothetical protein [Ramlibacter sp. AN1133]|uniref:hypothetical protein n=1 Tax=Ramlibacter sp. AN1133 TaxID=3133429 RepID=UPI0030BFABDB